MVETWVASSDPMAVSSWMGMLEEVKPALVKSDG